MTDPAIIAASYAAERNYSHNPDDVIDASDAVGAWGTAKESTTELVDLSGNGNIADIHGAMPTEGFIQGRRFDGVDDYLNCGNDSSLQLQDSNFTLICLMNLQTASFNGQVIGTQYDFFRISFVSDKLTFNTYDTTQRRLTQTETVDKNKLLLVSATYNGTTKKLFVNGILNNSSDDLKPTGDGVILLGGNGSGSVYDRQIIAFGIIYNKALSESENISFFNILARLPFWSVNYTDYPDNVTEYTDNLPYSSSIISSGTFKVDDDKLQGVSAGTMTYSASYKFDGSEYIKVDIDGVEYAGIGTITVGNTTVSVAQGSNKITIEMGTGDAIEGEIKIQFRKEV